MEYSFSKQHVDALNAKGIGVMLTLSNHYFSEEAYQATIPVLEQLEHPLNSTAIVNDKLARRIAEDFPRLKRKASVIKLIKNLETIHRTLELYHAVVLHPMLNDDAEFLYSIDCKDNIILSANSKCLYKCDTPICYKYISKQMITQGSWEKQVCQFKHNRQAVEGYTIFDLTKEHFKGFSAFKLIPVPDDHLKLDYHHETRKTGFISTNTGIRMIR